MTGIFHTCGTPCALVGRAFVGPLGPVGRALVGSRGRLWAGPLWAPLGPCGLPWALVGPLGPCGPPWAIVGRALVGRALVAPPGPSWARP